MMKTITITLSGDEAQDMYSLEKICQLVQDGIRRGKNESDTGSYLFDVKDTNDG